MSEILFFIVILLANTIQGVTGFAGTILAMPFSLRLVGYEVAVPVLNLLGILAGIYVFVFNVKSVRVKELIKVVAVMAVSMLVGIGLKNLLSDYSRVTYVALGVIVLIIALKGLYEMFLKKESETKHEQSKLVSGMLLILAGIVHGVFVCGGPLLVGYLTTRIKDKKEFRATISTCWIFLNGLLMASQIKQGMWTGDVIRAGLISIPFLVGGMVLGSILCKRMNQRTFLILTYVLLVIAAISLFVK